MQLWFVFSLIFSIIIAAFAVLNSDTVTIKFFWQNVQLSQSLVILLSAVVGAAIVLFLGLFNKIKTTLKIRELNGKYGNAEKEIVRLNAVIKTYEMKEASYSTASKPLTDSSLGTTESVSDTTPKSETEETNFNK